MAERTIYTCDRCNKDWEGKQNNPFGVNWSWGDKLGIRTFILCGECTAALKAFLNLDPPRQEAPQVDP